MTKLSQSYLQMSTAQKLILLCFCAALLVLIITKARNGAVLQIVTKPGVDSPRQATPKLLLVSYDGFRWDYLSHGIVPNLRYLIQNGVTATQGLKNTFITITAPNHYGIVTGLYEETHGIVANDFYDPNLKERFDYFSTGSRTDPRFFGGLPIWAVNDAQGGDRRTGCVMWVGCDVSIQGHPLPLHHISWNNTQGVNPSWADRVDYVISWFKDPKEPINLGLLYIEEPDETGHQYGPHGAPTLEKVRQVDQLTGYLLWCLEREGLLDEVNLILTADHGMADVPVSGGIINLANYLQEDWFYLYGGFPGPNGNIQPTDGHMDDVLNTLKKVEGINVYTNDTVPPDYHYSKNPRIMPVQVEADLHRVITNQASDVIDDGHGRKINLTGRDGQMFGAHGYNNSKPEMHPYFVAYGPAFKRGFSVDTFYNLDIFPLMAHILGVEAPPNNGSLDRVKALLAESDAEKDGNIGVRRHMIMGCCSMTALILIAILVGALICKRRDGNEQDENFREKYDEPILIA